MDGRINSSPAQAAAVAFCSVMGSLPAWLARHPQLAEGGNSRNLAGRTGGVCGMGASRCHHPRRTVTLHSRGCAGLASVVRSNSPKESACGSGAMGVRPLTTLSRHRNPLPAVIPARYSTGCSRAHVRSLTRSGGLFKERTVFQSEPARLSNGGEGGIRTHGTEFPYA